MAFGGVIKLQGESEYRAALKQIQNSLAVVGSEMQKVSSQFAKGEKSVQSLTSKNEVLNKRLSEQQKAVSAASKMLSEAQSKYNESSKAVQDWEKQLEAAKKALEAAKNSTTASADEIEKLENNVKECEQGLSKANTENEKYNTTVQKWQTELNKAEAAVNKTTREIESNEAAIQQLESATEDASGATETLTDKVKRQESELEELKKQYTNVAAEQGQSSDEARNLASQIENLSGELRNNRTTLNEASTAADSFDHSLEDVDNEAHSVTNGGLSAFAVALGNLASQIITNVISKMKDLVTETITVGKTFDSSMSQVSAVSGATADEIEQLRNKAKEMGSTTKFTASEAADAFNYMAMAGWKTEDMLSGINGVLNLAAASGSDLATTSDIVTDALTAMGYSAGDAGRLADVMAAASSNANTNVEMMGQTFQYAAPVVGALGYNMEDTAVAIGLMANAGIKADKAGTALRSILTRLATDAGASKNQLGALGTITEELGVQFYNTDGTTRALSDVLNECREAWSGLTAEQQTSFGKQIAGQEALSGWLAIMNAAPEDVKKLTLAVEESDGAAQKMADTMLNNLGGDMTLLSSKLEGVQIAIYEKFEPALRKGVELLSKLLDAVQFVTDHSAEFITALTAMAAAVGAYVAYTTAITVMTKGWAALTVVTKAQAAAQAALNAIMAMNPIGLVIAAVAGLVTAFIMLWKKSESFRNFWKGMWAEIKKTVEKYIGAVVDFFKNAWKKIESAWSGVKDFFKGIWESIKSTFSAVGTWFGNKFKEALNAITTAWGVITEFFSGIWEGITNVFASVGEFFKEKFQAAADAIKAIFEAVATFFSDIWDKIKTTISEKIEAIKSAITTVFNAVKDFVINVWDKIKSSITEKIEAVKTTVSNVVNAIKDVITSIFNAVSSFVSNVWNGIKNAISNAINGAKDVVSNVVNGIKNTVTSVFDGLKNSVSNVWNGIKNTIKGAIEGARDFVKNAIDKIKGFFNFEWKLPKIKLPHFSIKGEFSLTPPSVPHLSVDWYAKAMRNPMLLDAPTIFGMQGNKLLGAGESGPEVVSGASKLMEMIRDAVITASSPIRYSNISSSRNVEAPRAIDDSLQYQKIISAFKEALREMKVEMDSDEMGRFVERTVADAIYT